MKIIVDAFGGDNAPGEILRGCAQAQTELGIQLALAGDKDKLLACAKELGCRPQDILHMEIRKKSIDARKKDDIPLLYTVDVTVHKDESKILRRLIDRDEIPSMIFWGPPGVGKTTLAY